MWLILCSSNDHSGIWAFEQLKSRGLAPIELITDASLSPTVRWEHRITEDGVFSRMELADGRSITNREVRGVLNRLLFVPADNTVLISSADRTYVSQEIHSFYLSWLHSFPGPVLNRVTPFGLSGQHRHISEWIWLASVAGLPTLSYRQGSFDATIGTQIHPRASCDLHMLKTLVAVDGHVVDDSVPEAIKSGCLRLAALSATRILGVDFNVDRQGNWMFIGATTHPDLTAGGEPLLMQLLSVFRRHAS